ncbi:MAG: cyclic nucleotide-binding domain-containing protein [Magnetococcales bacterium]|nr:cyclic nucleotide-binding domain-containing protein [Magnetococcales bacterium]MBF0151754.1 cyclic nucleotide-binding domain-containing protein [Magnetococcales bacterium]MBF0173281.1 cyclic nucleotide-binding domain-containing protein [Magnetococcales bacterium]MBF0346988.1 cyclic nucleotide-binding domain-containing protein [Magnetococcales bacterium]MBF0631308.1 cyclic nucleotide-binding domain-containing protein [Magnetococcales bacterium]
MSLIGLMESITFFESFTTEEKSSFVQTEDLFVTLKPGEFLIKEGPDEDDSFFIVMDGQVNITKEGLPGKVLATLGSGSVLGEMTFLTGRPRSTNVITEEGVTVFKVNQGTMNRLKAPMQVKILRQLTDILVGRLEQLTEDIVQQKRINETLTLALREKVLSNAEGSAEASS